MQLSWLAECKDQDFMHAVPQAEGNKQKHQTPHRSIVPRGPLGKSAGGRCRQALRRVRNLHPAAICCLAIYMSQSTRVDELSPRTTGNVPQPWPVACLDLASPHGGHLGSNLHVYLGRSVSRRAGMVDKEGWCVSRAWRGRQWGRQDETGPRAGWRWMAASVGMCTSFD
ncbi:uncharacterized protein CC84DRAFT_721944 [Paraphaeosphaeria sporulosa]|uniref:Uncharacterized protein n=1 Tax=Paraphaeosphaeria sporulosa TaxID=1460663 RepID=A0A177CDW1_9PLEO|nr:uncharacterized protein CC84DRAFT_721944 [Paraphaeosphaeria sporulosa]OAG05411.1 hypothetical protein CC84DRAFT_721944 [Paraphaeosphaeria sporulosa]